MSKKIVISASDNLVLKLRVLAKEKENIRRKLVVMAKRLAVTAKKKEDVRKKLEITAKKLAVTAKELEDKAEALAVIAKDKEDVRLKLVVTAKELEDKAEALAVIAKEKEDVRLKLVVATDKLVREEKLATIGKLAGIMGHEIRNPLGVIRNSIYFLNIKFKESIDEKVRRHMEILETEIDSCDKIISDVLEFARTRPPSLTEAEINSVVEAVLSKTNIPKTIKVQADLGENLPKINIDIAQVKQVFSNIISNAIEAMPKGGELRVTTSLIDSFISIALKDTGVGIPKENIDKLFTPLFSTKTKGLGLGLAACQNIISAHHGKIEFESQEGQGTAFIIKLPITPKVGTGQVPMTESSRILDEVGKKLKEELKIKI
ncbi:MAG: ATP-binding protein [bacterium]|nr:ATP-binding protein [bacterium]